MQVALIAANDCHNPVSGPVDPSSNGCSADKAAICGGWTDVCFWTRSYVVSYRTEMSVGLPNCTNLLQQLGFLKGTRSMISYLTVGADDIARAKRFYSAFLPALGYELTEGPEGISCVLSEQSGQSDAMPELYIRSPFDGRPASAGNGSMIALKARSQKQVRDLHSAAIVAGGTDEGQPGFRQAYGPRFYVAYLRDPQGNKIALFSNDPSEPGRDG